jgi:hypothetical protein
VRSKCLASPTRGSSSLAHSAKHSTANRFRIASRPIGTQQLPSP